MDDRRLLIQAEHPEFDQALASGQREVHLEGMKVNPALHIAMHEIVANQLWANDPPEMWETAVRLLAAGTGVMIVRASARKALAWLPRAASVASGQH